MTGLFAIGYSAQKGVNYVSIKEPSGFESGGSLGLTPESVLQEKDLLENKAKYLDTNVTAAIFERGYPSRGRTVLKIRPAEQ